MKTEPDVSATLKIKLKPWTAPNYVGRADSSDPTAPSIPVADLDDDALEDLALAWLRDLYTKAGRRHCPFRKETKLG